MTKTKKEKVCVDGEEAAELPAVAEGNGKSYHELVANVNPIAQPLASKKLSKKLYKCVKKGSFNPSLRPPETFFKVIFWLGYFNSCLNPIIYPCYSREFKQAFIRILQCQWKRKRQRWQAYPNYRRHQGSNNSSFLNSSQQALSSVSPSSQYVSSRPHPPTWPHPSGRKLHSGPTGRGGPGSVSRLAKGPGTGIVVNNGQCK